MPEGSNPGPPGSQPPARPTRPVIRRSGEIRTGSQPGNQRVRLSRAPEQTTIQVKAPPKPKRAGSPALIFVYGFGGLIAIGTILLMLPISSQSGEWTPLVDAFFTATSAVCVTGLAVLDTGTYWSPFGQAVVLALFQLGGLGFMTSSTLLFLLLRRRLTVRNRLALTESLGTTGPGGVLALVRRITIFVLVVEAIGATILVLAFLPRMEPGQAVWAGVFTAISGFNQAGFDLFGNFASISAFAMDPVVVLTVGAMIVMGGISYTVVEDLLRERRLRSLSLDTKLVLATTALLLGLGTFGFLITETANPDTLGAMPVDFQLLNAFFQSITTRSGGFSTFDNAALTDNGSLVTMALMFIGGASGSAAGGIKVQTFAILFFAIITAAMGLSEVEAFKRRVPLPFILRAIGVALLFLAGVFLTAFLLNVTDDFGFVPTLFEAFSAMGTVGLSQGITPDLSTPGKIIVIAAMFAGRLGPLTLVLALANREQQRDYRWPAEAIKIG